MLESSLILYTAEVKFKSSPEYYYFLMHLYFFMLLTLLGL